LEIGWLAGLVDGEGFIHIRYRSDRGTMYPRMRIYGTTKPIIDEAARLMGMNPFPRRDHGVLVGWYASVSHRKALRVLRIILPYLRDPSKKCRGARILETFGEVGTVHGRLSTPEFFADCPPPTRLRKPRSLLNASESGHFSEVGKPDPLWG
jgi:hypothetical protein